MKSHTRRSFLKLCTFALPIVTILSKIPPLKKPVSKLITLPTEKTDAVPLFSFGNDTDIGWGRIGEDKLFFTFGDSSMGLGDVDGSSGDQLSLKAGGIRKLKLKSM